MTSFEFHPAKPEQKRLILKWLARPHVTEWLHGDGYRNTIVSLDGFLSGRTADPAHWIAYLDGRPIAYLITSRVDPTDERYAAVAFAGDTGVSIDVFIGDTADTGHGHGTALIRAFLAQCLPDASDAVIDPEASNARAVHVYRKVGFRIVDTFIAPWHPVPHFLMHTPLTGGLPTPSPAWAQIETLLSGFERILAGTLAGVYVHGSLAFGCFNPASSDIDLLVVTERRITPSEKRALVEELLGVSLSPHPVEISFLAASDIAPWRHPAPYDLHFSEDWRERYRKALSDGSWAGWSSPAGTDDDLAAHIVVTRETGLTLHGRPPVLVLPEVPYEDVAASIRSDLAWAIDRAAENPVYLVLNACRASAFFTERKILSKRDGARWALGSMPTEFHDAIRAAARLYDGGGVAENGAMRAGPENAVEIAKYVLARA
ncbi:MAG: GNAT family N-acetyltransferase [Spirochaetaceae bacterium]|nr:MAG: GNAT family N-acetyltransferase [Spirochaetaceae bacterium]